jgi:hypothetical protein
MTAFDSSGAITLPAAHLKIDVAYPRGKKEQCELTVVYNPQTQYYLWHAIDYNPRRPSATKVRLKDNKAKRVIAFADTAELVEFSLYDGLFAKVWRNRADSLDAAVSAATEQVRQGLALYEGVGFQRDYKLIPVFGVPFGLMRDFRRTISLSQWSLSANPTRVPLVRRITTKSLPSPNRVRIGGWFCAIVLMWR